MLKGKKILITGGTGSFGNAYLEKYFDSEIEEFRIISRDEKKQHDMRIKFNSSKIKFYIGDVRDKESLKSAVEGVDYIFHAAALKQVPSCEFFPIQATSTNILGTNNLIQTAIENNVKSVVCLSTDKAAYPINAMGMTKALMEKTALSHSRIITNNSTRICITRYGNVMASRGSVIPLFIKQIKSKENLTVTHPKMTRFLMSLDEAVGLVMYAFENGKQGDLFVQKSPACTVEDLAKALIEIFNSKSKIEIIGIRHGEKMYETLCTSEEMSKSHDLKEYFRIPIDSRDLNYKKYFSEGINETISQEYNSNNTKILSIDEIKTKLLKLPYVINHLQ